MAGTIWGTGTGLCAHGSSTRRESQPGCHIIGSVQWTSDARSAEETINVVTDRMAHDQITDELRERLTLYSLDLLDPEDASEVDRHLEQGCAVCRDEVSELRETFAACLSAGLKMRQPPARLRERVLAAASANPRISPVWKQRDRDTVPELHVVRRGEGAWEMVAPGVSARRLYLDPERESVTMLVRMAPGATYSAHRHALPEQCYVLEGDLSDGTNTFRAGDFQCAAKGSIHGVQSTREGCLLLIVSSPNDQLLA